MKLPQYSVPFLAMLWVLVQCMSHTFSQQPNRITASISSSGDQVLIHRMGVEEPILTQVATLDARPCLHPIVAPDGQGLLTEFRPEHHPHQTGLFWGFTRVNGRDYFHHPENGFWKRVSVSVLKAEAASQNDSVQWQTVYDLLDAEGKSLLRESQIWTMRDENSRYLLDLQWTGDANVDVTIGEFDYGGLFLRMPWKRELNGEVVNNIRQRNLRADGQRAVWVDVGLQVDGRNDMAHIAIFDHPQNGGYPQTWRVDEQLGMGPVRARAGDWHIVRGQQETIRHRMIVYTGTLNDVELTAQWSAYSGQNKDSVQWQLAQQEGRKAEFLTPEKAVANMTLQDGFKAQVYASEPMIAQPMAFCWDAKGRMWIAENRDYETRQAGFSNDGSSRILILEDTDHDGVADSRKVFLEGIPFPSAMAVGMGGLWLGAPPNLLFVPDRNDDDQADMDKIEVRLTGWGIRDRHETLNSFIWGPDGWLYGLQGYATPSKVGKPLGKGRIVHHHEKFPEKIEFDGKPVDIDGGVWRYHPTKDRFEVVSHGFSNPWGIDYDARGQLFITACVIPHLWHVIPGGIYHRQGGSHFNPFVYSDITTIADHRHQSAHGGARIYQSDALPEKYQGRIFMANIHEHAVLTDILEPKGSGFIGHHGDDFMLANNAQWIGFSIEVGPDGAIYVLDWHDGDICGKEVLNKETGRVFRIAPIQSDAASFDDRYVDLNTLDDAKLASMQRVASVWHANNARTILQHRSRSRSISTEAITILRNAFQPKNEIEIRLRAMWALHVTNAMDQAELLEALRDHEAYIRAWAIQLLCEDFSPPSSALSQFIEMAERDSSPVVRLYLASAVQRVPTDNKWALLEKLALHGEDNNDHNIPKMLWFGLEPLVVHDIDRALALASHSKVTMLSRSVARRLGDAERFDDVLAIVGTCSSDQQLPILLGMRDASEGRFDMKPPKNWSTLFSQLETVGGEVTKVAVQLSQQFGDSLAAEAMLKTLRNRSSKVEDRRQAIQSLAGRKRPELKSDLIKLLDEDAMRRDVIRAMSSFDEVSFGKELIKRYSSFTTDEKREAVQTLATRTTYGNELTSALKNGNVPKRDVPADVARVLRRVVGNRFIDVWGPIDALGADKEAQFVKYRDLLNDQSVKNANIVNGRVIFNRSCVACHQLHGHGGRVGPDITGANRSNLEYLLSNILTPSAIIQDAYRMHLVLTDDGRVYSGIPVEETERQLKLRVANHDEPIAIPKSEIESREIASVSMMPDGILANLKDIEVIDLIAYLQSTQQVDLP